MANKFSNLEDSFELYLKMKKIRDNFLIEPEVVNSIINQHRDDFFKTGNINILCDTLHEILYEFDKKYNTNTEWILFYIFELAYKQTKVLAEQAYLNFLVKGLLNQGCSTNSTLDYIAEWQGISRTKVRNAHIKYKKLTKEEKYLKTLSSFTFLPTLEKDLSNKNPNKLPKKCFEALDGLFLITLKESAEAMKNDTLVPAVFKEHLLNLQLDKLGK